MKYRNGFLIRGRYETPFRRSSNFPLTLPNVGVETGQVLFIIAVVAVLEVLKRIPLPVPEGAWRVLPYTIGGIAAFWTIERVTSFM